MIEATSIKSMFKAYTLHAMAKAMGTYKDKHDIECPILPRVQLDMWSNGIIAIFAYDPLPKSLIKYGAVESDNLVMRMADVTDGATIPAYPVLMGHTIDYKAMTDAQKEMVQGNLDFIKFSIEDGEPVLFNPRYIVNLLNRSKSRKKDKTLEWFYNPRAKAVKLVEDGKTLGVLCEMALRKGAMALFDDPSIFEWRFVNEEKDTPFLTVEEETAFVEHDAQEPVAVEVTVKLDLTGVSSDEIAQVGDELIALAQEENANAQAMVDAYSQENADAYKDDDDPFATMPDPIKVVDSLIDAIDAYVENDDIEPPAVETEIAPPTNDPKYDVDGSEYTKALSDAKKIKPAQDVVGGLITLGGLVSIKNVCKSKRGYDPDQDALEAVLDTLPENAFDLGLWMTSTNKSPGKVHFGLAAQEWENGSPGIVVICPEHIYGIGKDEAGKNPDKIKITFTVTR